MNEILRKKYIEKKGEVPVESDYSIYLEEKIKKINELADLRAVSLSDVLYAILLITEN